MMARVGARTVGAGQRVMAHRTSTHCPPSPPPRRLAWRATAGATGTMSHSASQRQRSRVVDGRASGRRLAAPSRRRDDSCIASVRTATPMPLSVAMCCRQMHSLTPRGHLPWQAVAQRTVASAVRDVRCTRRRRSGETHTPAHTDKHIYAVQTRARRTHAHARARRPPTRPPSPQPAAMARANAAAGLVLALALVLLATLVHAQVPAPCMVPRAFAARAVELNHGCVGASWRCRSGGPTLKDGPARAV